MGDQNDSALLEYSVTFNRRLEENPNPLFYAVVEVLPAMEHHGNRRRFLSDLDFGSNSIDLFVRDYERWTGKFPERLTVRLPRRFFNERGTNQSKQHWFQYHMLNNELDTIMADIVDPSHESR